jgi:glycosyltransferase involved in cell wall biosynthesis
MKKSTSFDSMAVVGVDATRNRSGGAIAHIKGLFSACDPRDLGVSAVNFWAHDELLDMIDEEPWLIKHKVAATRKSIFHQMAWQRFALPSIARSLGVQAMFNTDAGSLCTFGPSITLSQDMLSFEPGEMNRYPWSTRARYRLEALRFIQLARLKNSTVSVFLTQHACDVITGLAQINRTSIIPHGIDQHFLSAANMRPEFPAIGKPIRCLYVSNAAPYKHQWHVIEAVAQLRAATGSDLRLRLVGGGSGKSQERIISAMKLHDSKHEFVEQLSFIPNAQVVDELASSDIFIFASSCENLPITLLEAMASGIPIACSNRGPMPEVLGPNGFYFEPEIPSSIASALKQLISDGPLRHENASSASRIAGTYTWEKCARSTWMLLREIARDNSI